MSDTRPNFLLVFPDQHRGDCLSLAGRPGLMTPNLDFLASEGAYFSHAYTPCPACSPTRRSFMLGQSPATNGVVGMGIKPPQSLHSSHTLCYELKRADYDAAVIGKAAHQANPPEEHGFDYVRSEKLLSWFTRTDT
jgi:arylsulfatase A-like enzyme